MGVDHKPGFLKQTNKSHKHGCHKSKRAIDKEAKGKVSVKTLSRAQSILSRDERRLRLNHIRKNKRDEAIEKKRTIGGHGSHTAPFLTAIITLNESIDALSALSIITKCDAEALVTPLHRRVTHMTIPRFKQKFSFVCPRMEKGNELTTLDCLKVCDSVLFVTSAAFPEDDIIDKWGNKILNMALAQGVALPIVTLMDLESIAPKKRAQTKTIIQKVINKILPDEKVLGLETNADGLNVLRRIGDQKRKVLHNKENRPHLYSEKNIFVPDKTDDAIGTLQCSGYLRGVQLSANNLVYVPGLGDFQVSKIEAPPDPFRLLDQSESNNEMDEIKLISVSDPVTQTELLRENLPDTMDAEQTWPTEEEIAHSRTENKKLKLIKRIPKGMSDYQACWIPDIEEVEDESDDSDQEDEENFMSCESDNDSDPKSSGSDDDEEDDNCETATVSEVPVNDEKYDKGMDFDEEKKTMEKLKLERTDAMFPDEIDTPLELPARLRFKKYRGLESFRTSTWDSKENLPNDYARIFQFQNFDRTKRRIIKEAKNADGALPGWYVTVHIIGVSKSSWEQYRMLNNEDNMIIYGMLQHEHQMSVMNVVLKRTPNSTIPIASKERMIVQCGYRRFIVNPIYSQHTNGDKHKYERFFRPHTTVVATFYAPIQYPPAPVLCFRENPDTSITMIASGNVLSCNPNRIVLKRVVLSGNPYKIHKKSATIRYMFFNKEDIEYFKPCKLRTKCGRLGHIRESLGTHGHMKCIFDGPLKSYDTVFLYLYKRIFSKWTYEDFSLNSVAALTVDDEKMQE